MTRIIDYTSIDPSDYMGPKSWFIERYFAINFKTVMHRVAFFKEGVFGPITYFYPNRHD